MGVHLVLALAALVDERELEERAHVGALAGERDEERDVGGAVLGALAVGVEVDGPLEAADGEGLGGDVLADPDPLGERVARDLEVVRPVDGLGDGGGGRLDGGRRGGGGGRGRRRGDRREVGPARGRGGGGPAAAGAADAHLRRVPALGFGGGGDPARIGRIGAWGRRIPAAAARGGRGRRSWIWGSGGGKE